MGAILTQSVSWGNVETALRNLYRAGLLHPQSLSCLSGNQIASFIRPAGYYNQKAKKICAFLDWFKKYAYDFSNCTRDTGVLRQELLGIWGIGPETADSILLYALQHTIFVVDAYTKRIFSRIGLFGPDEHYQSVQFFFHEYFPASLYRYNEYHALIVMHAKVSCRKEPSCPGCCLRDLCNMCL